MYNFFIVYILFNSIFVTFTFKEIDKYGIENVEFELKCNINHVLIIKFAKYYYSENLNDVTGISNELCSYKNICQFIPTNDLFGDPFQGNLKRYVSRYVCIRKYFLFLFLFFIYI